MASSPEPAPLPLPIPAHAAPHPHMSEPDPPSAPPPAADPASAPPPAAPVPVPAAEDPLSPTLKRPREADAPGEEVGAKQPRLAASDARHVGAPLAEAVEALAAVGHSGSAGAPGVNVLVASAAADPAVEEYWKPGNDGDAAPSDSFRENGVEAAPERAAEERVTVEGPAENLVAAEDPAEQPIAAEIPAENPDAAGGHAEKQVAAEDAAEQPIVAEDAAEKPIAAEGHAEKEVAAEEHVEQPIAAENPANKPVAAEGHAEKHVAAEDPADKSIAAEGYAEQPVATEGHAGRQIAAEDPAEKPVAAEGYGETPVAAEGCAETPVAAEGHAEEPVAAEDPAESVPILVEPSLLSTSVQGFQTVVQHDVKYLEEPPAAEKATGRLVAVSGVGSAIPVESDAGQSPTPAVDSAAQNNGSGRDNLPGSVPADVSNDSVGRSMDPDGMDQSPNAPSAEPGEENAGSEASDAPTDVGVPAPTEALVSDLSVSPASTLQEDQEKQADQLASSEVMSTSAVSGETAEGAVQLNQPVGEDSTGPSTPGVEESIGNPEASSVADGAFIPDSANEIVDEESGDAAQKEGPPNIGASAGLGLRSAPVMQPSTVPTASSAAPAEPVEKPKKQKKSVSWAPAENLVDVLLIDTRLELIKNWDPDSEITLPFAPATLAHLRAQAEVMEGANNDGQRGAGRGTNVQGAGRGGIGIRSAPQVNDFELARRREHEMELERARQVRQELQARLNEMKADRTWQPPVTIILPSECRVSGEGDTGDGLDSTNRMASDDQRSKLEFYVPWLGDDVDPRKAELSDSPGSPMSCDDLETDESVIDIPLTEPTSGDSEMYIENRHEKGTNRERSRCDIEPSPPQRFVPYPSSKQSNKGFNSTGANHQRASGGGGVGLGNMQRASPPMPMAPQQQPPPLSVAALQAVGNALRSNPVNASPPSNISSVPAPQPVQGNRNSRIAPIALQQLLVQLQSGGMPLPPPHFLPPMPGMHQAPRPPPGMPPIRPPPPPPGMMGMPMMGHPMPLPPHMMNSMQQQQQQQQQHQQLELQRSPQGQPLQQPLHQGPRNNRKSNTLCRYFNTKQGCRDGDSCNFQHIPERGR